MSRIIANFVLKLPNFRHHGNKGRSQKSLLAHHVPNLVKIGS